MKRQIFSLSAPLAAVSLLLVLAVLSGCKKEQEKPVYASRVKDPAYQQELREIVNQKARTAKTRAQLVAQMNVLKERARLVLPKGATEAQVKAELDANPAKYPGWNVLSAELTKVEAAAEKELADARSMVRRRILKETADREAAAKGKATAKQPVVSK